MSRHRHPKKDLEAVLRDGEAKGWEVAKTRKYYRMRCPCGSHQKTVHLTPSDPNYRQNLVGWLRSDRLLVRRHPMTRFYLEITVQLRGATKSTMDELFEPLADAVYDLADVIDADLGADADSGRFDFTMAVDADSEVAALQAGLVAVRSAIHAAGHATPGWEEHFETIQQVVRREAALNTV